MTAFSKTLNNFRNFTQLVGAIYHRRDFAGLEKFVHIVQVLVWFQTKDTYVLFAEYSYQWSQEERLKKTSRGAVVPE